MSDPLRIRSSHTRSKLAIRQSAAEYQAELHVPTRAEVAEFGWYVHATNARYGGAYEGLYAWLVQRGADPVGIHLRTFAGDGLGDALYHAERLRYERNPYRLKGRHLTAAARGSEQNAGPVTCDVYGRRLTGFGCYVLTPAQYEATPYRRGDDEDEDDGMDEVYRRVAERAARMGEVYQPPVKATKVTPTPIAAIPPLVPPTPLEVARAAVAAEQASTREAREAAAARLATIHKAHDALLWKDRGGLAARDAIAAAMEATKARRAARRAMRRR